MRLNNFWVGKLFYWNFFVKELQFQSATNQILKPSLIFKHLDLPVYEASYLKFWPTSSTWFRFQNFTLTPLNWFCYLAEKTCRLLAIKVEVIGAPYPPQACYSFSESSLWIWGMIFLSRATCWISLAAGIPWRGKLITIAASSWKVFKNVWLGMWLFIHSLTHLCCWLIDDAAMQTK